MSDILDETLYDIQKEKHNQLVNKYGKPLLILIIISVIAGVAIAFWSNKKADIAKEEGAAFIGAVQGVKDGKNIETEAFEKLSHGKSAYASLASLNLALIESYSGKFDQAIHTYDELAANSNADDSFKEYSALMSITMKLAGQKIDSAEALKLLEAYLQKKNAIFKNSALELKASLLLEAGDNDGARAILEDILNGDAAAPVKAHAYQLLLIATPNN